MTVRSYSIDQILTVAVRRSRGPTRWRRHPDYGSALRKFAIAQHLRPKRTHMQAVRMIRVLFAATESVVFVFDILTKELFGDGA